MFLNFSFLFSWGGGPSLNLLFFYFFLIRITVCAPILFNSGILLGWVVHAEGVCGIQFRRHHSKKRHDADYTPPPSDGGECAYALPGTEFFPIPNFHFYEYLLSRADFQWKNTRRRRRIRAEADGNKRTRESDFFLSFFLCVCWWMGTTEEDGNVDNS